MEKLIDGGFDLTVCESLDVDHGLTVLLSVFCPEPGDRRPRAVVPLLVNVIRYPQPTAAMRSARPSSGVEHGGGDGAVRQS